MTYVRDVVDKSFVDEDLFRFYIFGSSFILNSYLFCIHGSPVYYNRLSCWLCLIQRGFGYV